VTRDQAADRIPVLVGHPTLDGRVRVWCTHCRAWHYHGAADGHRAARCHKPDSPYAETGYIIEVQGRPGAWS